MTNSNVLARKIPLFPLETVLFPGGVIALKIFEARYLDMIQQCLREKTEFGVVSIIKMGILKTSIPLLLSPKLAP